MKKLYSLIAAVVLFISASYAQCTVDTMAQTTPGVNPSADNLPCIERSVAYNQTAQGKIQESGDTTLNLPIVGNVTAHFRVDSVIIDSITGAPSGIAVTWAPAVIYGGGNGCVNFNGTTTAAAGAYQLTVWGTAYLRAQGSAFGQNIDTPYVRSGNLNRYSPFGEYYLQVVDQGAPCVHTGNSGTGINDFNAELNAAFSLYPNPSTGVFELRLNANRVNGEVEVFDITGRVVYNQKLDVVGLYNTTIDLGSFAKGLYSVRLRTEQGFAVKNISIE